MSINIQSNLCVESVEGPTEINKGSCNTQEKIDPGASLDTSESVVSESVASAECQLTDFEKQQKIARSSVDKLIQEVENSPQENIDKYTEREKLFSRVDQLLTLLAKYKKDKEDLSSVIESLNMQLEEEQEEHRVIYNILCNAHRDAEKKFNTERFLLGKQVEVSIAEKSKLKSKKSFF